MRTKYNFGFIFGTFLANHHFTDLFNHHAETNSNIKAKIHRKCIQITDAFEQGCHCESIQRKFMLNRSQTTLQGCRDINHLIDITD